MPIIGMRVCIHTCWFTECAMTTDVFKPPASARLSARRPMSVRERPASGLDRPLSPVKPQTPQKLKYTQADSWNQEQSMQLWCHHNIPWRCDACNTASVTWHRKEQNGTKVKQVTFTQQYIVPQSTGHVRMLVMLAPDREARIWWVLWKCV